jgi:cyanophycin synthetase
VIGGPGDRRNEDLSTLGELAAGMFNQVVIKEDDDRRGRQPQEVADLIHQGLVNINPECRCQIILDETTAIRQTLATATAGSLVVILPEQVSRAINLVEEHGASLGLVEPNTLLSNGKTPTSPEIAATP